MPTGFFKNTNLTNSNAPAAKQSLVKKFAPVERTTRTVTTPQKFTLPKPSNKSSCKSCGS